MIVTLEVLCIGKCLALMIIAAKTSPLGCFEQGGQFLGFGFGFSNDMKRVEWILGADLRTNVCQGSACVYCICLYACHFGISKPGEGEYVRRGPRGFTC